MGTCRRFTRAGINAGASIVTRGTACLPTESDSIRLLIVTAAAASCAPGSCGALKADNQSLANVYVPAVRR
jgi:hypothetical protein